jgi:hypothetical protein
MYICEEQERNQKKGVRIFSLCILVTHRRHILHTVGIQECLLYEHSSDWVCVWVGMSILKHICGSEVLTTGRASSRGAPMTFILPPLVLRSRILA